MSYPKEHFYSHLFNNTNIKYVFYKSHIYKKKKANVSKVF